MANITNRQLNISSAGQIALNLDKQDENGSDGIISKNIWDQFWEANDTDGKYAGKKEGAVGTGGISVREAMQRIMTRIFNAAKATGEDVNTVGANWLNKIQNVEKIDANQISELKEESNTSTAAEDVSGESESAATAAPAAAGAASNSKKGNKKYSAQDIKVTVPKKYMSSEAKKIISDTKEGETLRDKLHNGDTSGITEDNVAYAVNGVRGLNPQTREIVFNMLVKKMKNLKILRDGKDYQKWSSVERDLRTPTKEDDLINDYARRIIAAQNKIVNNSKKEKDAYNKDISKMQASFDKANQLLVDVANNPKKPEIVTDDDGSKSITLPSGQWMCVYYENGEISGIAISHTISKDENGDVTSTVDGAVLYYKDKAYVNTDINTTRDDRKITSGYNFEKLKKVAEAIFGK